MHTHQDTDTYTHTHSHTSADMDLHTTSPSLMQGANVLHAEFMYLTPLDHTLALDGCHVGSVFLGRISSSIYRHDRRCLLDSVQIDVLMG